MEEVSRVRLRVRKGDRSRGHEMNSGQRQGEISGANEGDEGAEISNHPRYTLRSTHDRHPDRELD